LTLKMRIQSNKNAENRDYKENYIEINQTLECDIWSRKREMFFNALHAAMSYAVKY
jgi:hypothetical protein